MPLAGNFLQSVETFASRDKLAPPWIRVATLMDLITFSDQGCYPNRCDLFLIGVATLIYLGTSLD